MSSSTKGVFHLRLSSVKGHLSSKDVFHQRFSSIICHLSSNVVFHQGLSSIKCRLPSKVVLNWRATSFKSCLHQRSSFIKLNISNIFLKKLPSLQVFNQISRRETPSNLCGDLQGWSLSYEILEQLIDTYDTLQYQTTFFIEIFFFSGSVWWLSIFMEMGFLQNSKRLFQFIQCLPQKIQVSAFWRNLGCAPYAQNLVFFKNLRNLYFFCFITHLVK